MWEVFELLRWLEFFFFFNLIGQQSLVLIFHFDGFIKQWNDVLIDDEILILGFLKQSFQDMPGGTSVWK